MLQEKVKNSLGQRTLVIKGYKNERQR